MKAQRLRIAVTAFALAFAFGSMAAMPRPADAGGGYSNKHGHHHKGHHGKHHHKGGKHHHAKPHKNDRIIVFRNGVRGPIHAPAFRTGKNQRVVIINPNHDRKFTKRKRFSQRGFVGRSYYHGGRYGNRWHRRHGRRIGSGTTIIIR